MNDSILRGARKNNSLILQQLAKVGQEKVAELIGCSGSTLSVFKAEHIERLSAILTACGLKVTLQTDESLSNDEVWALRVLAIKQLEARQAPSDSGFGGLA